MLRQRGGLGRGLAYLFVGLALGVLLSLGWRSQAGVRAGVGHTRSSKIDLSIRRLEIEQAELKGRLAELRRQLAAKQETAAAHTDRLQALQAELERQRLLAGLVPVQGPGLVVTLDDSAIQVPPGADPNAYIVHEYDLRDIVNLLWIAGSEAIAINDERIVSQSSIYCVGSTVMVNNTRLSPPYTIRAVGNSRVQLDYLRNPSYLKLLKEKERLYGLRFEIKEVANLTVPGYSGGFLIQYARPGE